MSKVERWVLDIEAPSLLPTVTKLTIAHLRAIDSEKGKLLFTNGFELVSALHVILKKGGIVICHNAQYDIGVLYKLYNFDMFKYYKQIECTLLISQLIFPKKRLSRKFRTDSYSLASWGKVLGKTQKIAYTGRYDVYSKELEEYLLADTQVTKELYIFLRKQKPYPKRDVIQLEVYNSLVSALIQIYGWKIDMELFHKQKSSFISKQIKIDMKLSGLFHPLYIQDKSRKVKAHSSYIEASRSFKNLLGIPKVRVDYKKLSKRATKKFIKTLREYPYRRIKVEYSKDYTNIKLDSFKPNSRQSVVKFMKHRFNTNFTILSKTNNIKLDKETFTDLITHSTNSQEKKILELLRDRFNISKIISEYSSIEKLILNGRIYASLNVLGASNTCRMCVPTNIRIKTPTGYKHKSELQVGDEVYAWDRVNEREVITKILNTHSYKEVPTGLLTNGEVSYRCTSNHKWVVGKELVEASKITPDMEIRL